MIVTYALSASDFIDDFGAYAGFAAFVALALVALLIFSQARELRRLRDWGAQAHDRIAELERGLQQALDLARRPAAPPAPRQPAPAAARPAQPGGAARPGAAPARTSAPVRPQPLPAAPVGVAAPALASATMLIPLPGRPASTLPDEPAPAPRRVGAPRPTVAAAAATTREAVPRPATVRGREAGAPPPRERDDRNGYHDDEPPARRAPLPAAGGRAGVPPRRGAERPAPRRGQPAAPLRASGAAGRPGAGAPSLLDEEPPRGRRRLLGVLGVLLALVVVVGGALMLLTGGDDDPARTTRVQAPLDGSDTARRQARRAQRNRAAAPPRAQTTVAVLNGTSTAGLASQIGDELAADGFTRGPVENASSTDRTVTVVSYRQGAERQAADVARALNLPADAVVPIDVDTETAACVNTSPCTAQVVVTVGADKQPTQ